jgi:hypothetical protein
LNASSMHPARRYMIARVSRKRHLGRQTALAAAGITGCHDTNN